MSAIFKLLMVAGAISLVYHLRGGAKVAATSAAALIGIIYFLPIFPNTNEHIDNVAILPHDIKSGEQSQIPQAPCLRLSEDQSERAIYAPVNDPGLAKNNLSMELLESATRTYRWTKVGHVEYYNSLAEIYESKGNFENAFNLYKEASDEGNAYGEFNIGRLYMAGVGTARQAKLALSYFEKAAAQNLPVAQFAVGQMYADGIGVSCNIAAAISWWTKAGRQGDIDAIAALGLQNRGHAQAMINKSPIEVDFTNPSEVIKAETAIITFAGRYDDKRKPDPGSRNAKIEAVNKACAAALDQVDQSVRGSQYTPFIGLQSWQKCYPRAESQLF